MVKSITSAAKNLLSVKRPSSGLPAALQKKAAPGVELIVLRVPVKNAGIVSAHFPGVDVTNPMNIKTVNVRDNTNFVPGMALRATPTAWASSFDLVGPLPRRKGAW
jgi:hypothetical protein